MGTTIYVDADLSCFEFLMKHGERDASLTMIRQPQIICLETLCRISASERNSAPSLNIDWQSILQGVWSIQIVNIYFDYIFNKWKQKWNGIFWQIFFFSLNKNTYFKPFELKTTLVHCNILQKHFSIFWSALFITAEDHVYHHGMFIAIWITGYSCF